MPESAAPSPPEAPSKTRIVFYCKDCAKLIDGIKVGKKYVYRCSACGTKNVAFGTEKSVRSFYRVAQEPSQVSASPPKQ